jgi:hypothetical protein
MSLILHVYFSSTYAARFGDEIELLEDAALSHADYAEALHENIHKEELVDYGEEVATKKQENQLENFIAKLQKRAHLQWNEDYCELKSYMAHTKTGLPEDTDKELVMMHYFSFGKKAGISCRNGWMDSVVQEW